MALQGVQLEATSHTFLHCTGQKLEQSHSGIQTWGKVASLCFFKSNSPGAPQLETHSRKSMCGWEVDSFTLRQGSEVL